MRRKVGTRGATLQLSDGGTEADASALIFLHYWGGSADTWRKVVALLNPSVRHVAIDQRGWGGSVAADGRYDLYAMADDVLAVAEQLGISRAILVGHSMGGKVAQIVASRHSAFVKGLVLVAPAPPTAMPVPEDVRAQMLESY